MILRINNDAVHFYQFVPYLAPFRICHTILWIVRERFYYDIPIQQAKIKYMWKKISSKTLLNHPRLKVLEDIVELPGGDRVPYILFGSPKPSVTTICIKNNSILLSREYSYPPNQTLRQSPGGGIETNETPTQAAKRELAEEAGLQPGRLESLGWFYTNNRRSDHKMHVFVAFDCVEIEKQAGDREEDIESEWVSIKKFEAMIKEQKIVNYSLLAAWTLFRTTYSARFN